MIYLNGAEIKDLGKITKGYVGDILAFEKIKQARVIIPCSSSLPNVPFQFNYNAMDYSNGVLHKTDGGLFDEDAVLNNPSAVSVNADGSINISSKSYFTKEYSNNSENPLNRNSENPTLTIVYKAKHNGTDYHLLSNRNISYNWMLRIGNSNEKIVWLHTSKVSASSAIHVDYTTVPTIVSLCVGTDGYGRMVNHTDNIVGDSVNADYGSSNNTFNLFYGGFSSEYFTGDFYWIYCSTEALTDEQIQQVIDYNESKFN